MTVSELRKVIKNILVAQNGAFYNYNFNCIKDTYKVSVTQLQNAYSYIQYSPQQSAFRKQIGWE